MEASGYGSAEGKSETPSPDRSSELTWARVSQLKNRVNLEFGPRSQGNTPRVQVLQGVDFNLLLLPCLHRPPLPP